MDDSDSEYPEKQYKKVGIQDWKDIADGKIPDISDITEGGIGKINDMEDEFFWKGKKKK